MPEMKNRIQFVLIFIFLFAQNHLYYIITVLYCTYHDYYNDELEVLEALLGLSGRLPSLIAKYQLDALIK